MLKGERDNRVAEEREKAEMDAMLLAKRVECAVRIQAAWRGCVSSCARSEVWVLLLVLCCAGVWCVCALNAHVSFTFKLTRMPLPPWSNLVDTWCGEGRARRRRARGKRRGASRPSGGDMEVLMRGLSDKCKSTFMQGSRPADGG